MAKGFTRSIDREYLYEVLKGFVRGGRGLDVVDGVYGNDMPTVDVGECDNDGAWLIIDNPVEERLNRGLGVLEVCSASASATWN
jgi:hypothetical protein